MNIVIQALKLFPAIIEVIKTIEEIWPEGKGAGKEKIAFARELLLAAHDGISEMWPTIERMIGVIVALFNAKGIFSK
jgi:hypothetical protein